MEPRAIDSANPAPADVLIVGAGMAGAILALVLARAGRRVRVFDLHAEPRSSFRAEKLSPYQLRILDALGALPCFQAVNWPADDAQGAYPEGRRPPMNDCGAPHGAWLAAVRSAWPDGVGFVQGAVARIETSADFQSVETARGERFTARLVVIATGCAAVPGAPLEVSRRIISPRHSISLGFSVIPATPVRATIVQAAPGTMVSYASLFPMPGEVRVNAFSYHALSDAWPRDMRRDPLAALARVAPQVGRLLGGARLVRPCEIRVSDLYETDGHIRPGVALIGDAAFAPCPTTGAGMSKVLNDVQLLSRRYIPDWLSTPGMSLAKIQAFYDDPVKRALDRQTLRLSLNGRSSILAADPYWRARSTLGRLKRRLAAARLGSADAPDVGLGQMSR